MCGTGLSSSEVAARLDVGRICGTRADIVHNWRAAVDYLQDRDFAVRLDKLHDIVSFCLRELAGLEPGDVLEKHLRPPTEPP